MSEMASRGSSRLEEARSELLTRVSELVPSEYTSVVEKYFNLVSPVDIVGRNPADLAAMITAHIEIGSQREIGSARVHAIAPSQETTGWSSTHSIVQLVTDDKPFLVDSVTAELNQQERGIHLIMHPRLLVQRDKKGRLVDILSSDFARDAVLPTDVIVESWICVEIDRETNPTELAQITNRISSVLDDVRIAVSDWSAMRQEIQKVISTIEDAPYFSDQDKQIAADFLRWLDNGHFTFLGYSYSTVNNGVAKTNVAANLGISRNEKDSAASANYLTQGTSDSPIILVTKSSNRSTVHRSTFMDYVGVREVDSAGQIIGEHRILGLLTGTAYTDTATSIPLLAKKVNDVVTAMDLGVNTHSGKDLVQFIETYPRDELFQISSTELETVARGVLQIQERRQVRLFARTELFGRFVSALVYFPRDRYTTEIRLRMESILLDAYGAESIDHSARVSESVLARLHFVVRMPKGKNVPDVDVDQLEVKLAEATRFWEDDFSEALVEQVGEEEAVKLLRVWAQSFPESFKEDIPAPNAVEHLRTLEELEGAETGVIKVSMYEPALDEDGTRRFTIYRLGQPITLSSVLPMLHDLGIEVIDERAYDLRRPGKSVAWVYDFGISFDETVAPDLETLPARFCATFMATWNGEIDSDGFNALVTLGGLNPRHVAVIRAYAAYLRQAGIPFSQGYLQQVLIANVKIVNLLLELFAVRFDPELEIDRLASEEVLVTRINSALDAVASLDHDRIMRTSVALVRATLRTNVYQKDSAGNYLSVMSFKLDPTKVPDLPLPVPKFEVWVYSPRVEGIHLRFASVARGGLRWSDRLEDFRTEVLGLVKAQMVKNTVIVPSGAKGGFVVKRGPNPADREAWLAEGIACYQAFIGALLDITDNLVDGNVVPPIDVVRHDVDDPYLVVAADKGTATFSDIANQISLERGFWMGDAFASGGSVGYDHKGMGITARGAWESVKRHFLELGIDTQSQDFTAVGVGDMSGDVFGNGMLLSKHIRLVAAFDHRHIFLDPHPDAANSFVERQRLFALPRSSWEDYNKNVISFGGGIFPRTAKTIELSHEVKEVLGIDQGIDSMSPNDLLASILKAPVDLLWNGGIGTYIKASTETHAQVGDKANDGLRINGSQLRCKVIGEGGNLGCTQLGRIEAAHTGVKINSDAIDNSAGVDTSDHEVNIKILLNQAMESTKLSIEQRNTLLGSMTDEVGQLVLRDNYEQNVILEQSRVQAPVMLRVHQRLIQTLESTGLLNRAVEYLPTDAGIELLHSQSAGLTSPELSVLMAYVKIDLTNAFTAETVVDEDWCVPVLTNYFPTALRQKYSDLMLKHPLRREIISTVMTNDMVNRGGISYALRANEESGATPSEVLRAYVVAREVFGFGQLWDEIEQLDRQVSTDCQVQLYLEARRLLDRATRWFLQSRGGRLDVTAEIKKFAAEVAKLSPKTPELLRGSEKARYNSQVAKYIALGTPEPLARKVAALLDIFSLLDVVEISVQHKADTARVVELYFALSERFDVDRLLHHISELPRDDRWTAYARSALRSDLYMALAGLTSRVVQATNQIDSVDTRITNWENKFAEGVGRTRATLNEIAQNEKSELATLSVALRAIRTLVGQGAS